MSYRILRKALQGARSEAEGEREETGPTGVQEAVTDDFVVVTLRRGGGAAVGLKVKTSSPLRKITDSYAAWRSSTHQPSVRFMVNGEAINLGDTPATLGADHELTIDVVEETSEQGAEKTVEAGAGGVSPDIRRGLSRKRPRAESEEEGATAPRSQKGPQQRPTPAMANVVVRPRGSVRLQLPLESPRGGPTEWSRES